MRADSSSTASTSSPSGRAPGWARATSAVWRMLASGERSSWEASATNCCCRDRESSRRPSIWFMVCASRRISSRERGSGTRRSSRSPLICSHLAPDAFDRRQRPRGHHPGGAAHEQEDQRHAHQQRGDQGRRGVVDRLQGGRDGDAVLLPAGPGVVGHHHVGMVGTRERCLVGVVGGQWHAREAARSVRRCRRRRSPARPGHRARRPPRPHRRARRPAAPRSRSPRPGSRRAGRHRPPRRRAGTRGPAPRARRPRRAGRPPPRAPPRPSYGAGPRPYPAAGQPPSLLSR